MAERQMQPFRAGTRKRRQFLTTLTYTGATAQQRPAPITLPSVGMFSRLFLVAKGNIDLSGAGGTIAVDGAAGLFNRLTVTANLGSSNIFDTSGPGAHVAANWQNPYAARASILDATDTTMAYAYYLPININANPRKNFALGLVNLQDPEIQVQFSVVFNPVTSVASLATAGGTTSITVDVYYEYWEIPDPRVFAMPPRALVRTLEEQYPTATVVGDNIYQVPRLGTMFMLAIIAYANSARMAATALSNFKIRFNKTDVIEERSGDLEVLLDQTDFGLVPGDVPGTATTTIAGSKGPISVEPGVFTWNGWQAEDVPSSGDFRDAIDTLELTTTEFIATVAAGTTVVSTDVIRVVRRVVQILG